MPIPDKDDSDGFCLQLLGRYPNAEALSWLEAGAGKHTLGVHESAEESLTLVRAAYAAGAVEVRAARIDTYEDMDGAQSTGKLVVTMPKEPEARARVLAWAAPLAEDQGYNPEPD